MFATRLGAPRTPDPAKVIDVFDAIATPRARKERPAVFAARVAWARRACEAARAAGQAALVGLEPDYAPMLQLGVFFVGDRVCVQVEPGQVRRGRIAGFERTPTGAIAHVDIDAAGDSPAQRIRAHRHRLAHEPTRPLGPPLGAA